MTRHIMNGFVFVCYFSVGKAEVPEGIRAVAAGHRGEWPSQRTTKWCSLVTAHTLTSLFFFFSGGVRGLERKRGQQEDLRGSEETRLAVDGKDDSLELGRRNGILKKVATNEHPSRFVIFFITHIFLFVCSNVVLQAVSCPHPHPLLW